MMEMMKFKIWYKPSQTIFHINFTDTNDALQTITVQTFGAGYEPRIEWPGNIKRLSDARLHADAITVAVKAAEIIKSGKRLEAEWEGVQVMLDERVKK